MRFIRWFTLPLVAVLLFSACVSPMPPAKHPDGDPTLPNMGQQITPWAPQDSLFENLNLIWPTIRFGWLASGHHRRVRTKRLCWVLTSGYNRIFRTNLVNGVLEPDAMGTYFNWPDSGGVCLRHLDKHAGQAAGRDSP